MNTGSFFKEKILDSASSEGETDETYQELTDMRIKCSNNLAAAQLKVCNETLKTLAKLRIFDKDHLLNICLFVFRQKRGMLLSNHVILSFECNPKTAKHILEKEK